MKSENKDSSINFNDAVDYVLKKLQKNKIAVLASCGADMRVSARSMSIVNRGLEIWFQTDSRFKKNRQMDENPFVALCLENIQIEGRVEKTGHSLDPENKFFCDEFELHHPGSYKAYTLSRDEVIYRVIAEQITLWRYDKGQSYRDFIDVQNRLAVREYYVVEPLS
ncbi:MAG TPA: pyridoxamine 5'-phosphate oxidase family protein [Spirochaetota bacterium]|nr:pyridoxamine 5'-phosphate oxidase family protein [Spirochaetota bacterium]